MQLKPSALLESNYFIIINLFLRGYVYEDNDCSHYMKDYYAFNNMKIKNDKARALFNHINKNYSTLAFCRRWLEEDGFNNHILSLKYLVDNGIVNPYPPLSDIKGSYVAQFEHTVLLKPTGKEILSRGDDY